MIDIHSHIIPGIDDGSSSIEESIEMLKIAENDGIATIVATPHIFGSVSKMEDPKELQKAFEGFKKKINQYNINLKVLLGAENFFVSSLREKLNEYREILTINNSDYFLLEFPSDFIFPGTKQFIFDVMTHGLIPIICHPERNQVIQRNHDILYQFLQIGALSQINAGSIRGDFGPEARITSMNLLKFNLVQVIASDSHNSEIRIPEMFFIHKELQGFEKEKIDMLVQEVPEAIINNMAIPDLGPIIDPKKKTSFFDFIRRKQK